MQTGLKAVPAATLFYFFTLLVTPFATAQGETGRLFIRNFDYKEYGGHQENWAVVQDKRGLMYFGNNWGILEYDTISWRLIKTEKQTSVLSMDVGSEGTIYVGLENGFGFLAPTSIGQMRFVSLRPELPESEEQVLEVWKVHATTHGTYFVTINKLYLWKKGKFQIWPITISALSTVVNDTLYFGEWQSGINFSAGGAPQFLAGTEALAQVQNYLIGPYESKKTLLLSTRERGLLKYKDRRLVPFKTDADDFLKKNQIYSSISLPGNRLLFGTIRGGVVILDSQGHILHKIDAQSGLRNDTIVAPFYNDRDGSVWLALSNGLAQVELSSPFTKFDSQTGLAGAPHAIIRYDGLLYVSTSRGVFYLTPNPEATHASFAPIQGLTTFAYGFHPTANALLVGTDKGLYQIKGIQATSLPGYPYRIYAFSPSQKKPNRLYAAIQRGVGVLEDQGGVWTYLGRVLDLNLEMTSIVVEADDSVWLGTNAFGTYRLSPLQASAHPDSQFVAEIEKYGPKDGLPEGEVNVFFHDGRVLFHTGAGLLTHNSSKRRFENDLSFGLRNGNHVGRMAVDQNAKIWTFTRRNGHSLVRVGTLANDNNYIWEDTPFRRLTDIGDIKVIYPDQNGVVWIGGTEGIIRYDSETLGFPHHVFQTVIRAVTVNGDSTIYGGSLPVDSSRLAPHKGTELHIGKAGVVLASELEHKNNAMRFEFAATSHIEPGATEFQSRLEGFNETWSPLSAESRKDYTNLPGGSYRFRVRARNVFGKIGSEDAFEFRIAPPYYRTWWAYLSYAMLAISIIMFLTRVQVKRSQREAKQALQREMERAQLREATLRAEAVELLKEREKEQMRGRIASDLHDEIGSNLSSISMISQMLQKKTGLTCKEKQRLRDVQIISQQTAQSMRDIVWFVNPKNDSLQKLFAKMRETANLLLEPIDFTFAAPDTLDHFDIDLNFRRNLFLIYKECLQNIIKHSKARKVEIMIRFSEDGTLAMRVQDDGVGFEQADIQPGNGLRHFEQRAADMNGKIAVNSGKNTGTAVCLTVKIPRSRYGL